MVLLFTLFSIQFLQRMRSHLRDHGMKDCVVQSQQVQRWQAHLHGHLCSFHAFLTSQHIGQRVIEEGICFPALECSHARHKPGGEGDHACVQMKLLVEHLWDLREDSGLECSASCQPPMQGYRALTIQIIIGFPLLYQALESKCNAAQAGDAC